MRKATYLSLSLPFNLEVTCPAILPHAIVLLFAPLYYCCSDDDIDSARSSDCAAERQDQLRRNASPQLSCVSPKPKPKPSKPPPPDYDTKRPTGLFATQFDSGLSASVWEFVCRCCRAFVCKRRTKHFVSKLVRVVRRTILKVVAGKQSLREFSESGGRPKRLAACCSAARSVCSRADLHARRNSLIYLSIIMSNIA